jgi:PAS domain S-box-containing protein
LCGEQDNASQAGFAVTAGGAGPRIAPKTPNDLDQSGAVFDRATRLAKALFGAVNAQVTLISEDGIWRSRDDGRPIEGAAQGVRTAISDGRPLWVEDASKDPRFRDEAMVKGPPYVRFFAAAPIKIDDGSIPGVIWVAGLEPRPLNPALARRLEDLADFAADEWTRVQAKRGREVARRESDAAQTMMAAIIQSAAVALVITDRQMRVISASPRWISSRGLDGQAVIGKSLYELSPIARKWRASYERCLGGETISAARVEMETPLGGTAWLQAEIAPWRDAAGEIGGLIVTSYDVTAMVEALERTERSEERLRLAMEIADLHVWELDYVREELTKVGAEDTFFTEPKTYSELVDDIWSTIDPRDHPATMAQWERHEQTGEPYRPEYRVVRNDDREVWALGAVRYFTDAAGKPLRLLGALQNITRRKLSERALVQAKEEAEAATLAKSAFLATMSHEIRTPLNGVLGMAQAMAMGGDLTDQQRERLDVIRQSGESLLAILNDVLDLSKIEAGKLTLEQAEFDISELARGAHATFAATAQAKGLAFELSVERSARGVYEGDSVRVRQILYNLVSNALKFTEAGKVAVTVSRVEETLRLVVRDTGIGVEPAKLATLFLKFEQADASTTRRYGGTGLGLAICRDLADMMGGSIAARSAPGQGATFTASLPLRKLAKAPAPSVPQAEMGPITEGASLRVLAAEDNGMNQLVLKTLLNQVGVDPVMVADGRAAVAAWEREPWDLVLMDVQMPEMDGPTATGVIRARERAEGRARTPIVALTANAMAHQVAEYRRAGMDDFVAKPIEAARLYAVVQAVLDAARKREASAA